MKLELPDFIDLLALISLCQFPLGMTHWNPMTGI